MIALERERAQIRSLLYPSQEAWAKAVGRGEDPQKVIDACVEIFAARRRKEFFGPFMSYLVFWHSELDAAGLNVYARAVLCELSKRANGREDGAFPSIRTIGKSCGMSHPVVIRSIEALKAAGLIRIKKAKGRPSFYTVLSLEEWREWKASKAKKSDPETGKPDLPVNDVYHLTGKQDLPDQSTTFTTPVNHVYPKEIPLERSHKEKESAGAPTQKFFSQFAETKKRKFDQLPSLSELTNYCAKLRLPETDALDLHDHWTGNGFKNKGKPIRDWQATVRKWKGRGYLLSQKQKPKSDPDPFQL
jgi:DNA-binding Lrp family transcriptional regulator